MFSADWRQTIADPIEIKIFEALENPQWEWRTIAALSKASGLDQESTRRVLQKYPALVRQSALPGPNGEELYTLQRRHFERQSLLEKVWVSVTSTSSST